MTKNVLIVSSSLRVGSNSEILAKSILAGAIEANHTVDYISLKDKDLKFCIGCLSCHKTKKCVIRDDMDVMIDKVRKAEVIVFATPLYYYELCGQLKTFLDRCNPLYKDTYDFRDIYFVVTAAEEEPEVFEKAKQGLMGWIDCYPKATLQGVLLGGGFGAPKSVESDKAILLEAYQLGLNI